MRTAKIFQVSASLIACALVAGLLFASGCSKLPPERPIPSSKGIEWLDWNKTSFDKAKQQGRLILVYLYSPASHTGALMDENILSLPEVAEMVGANFVPVKVNCDERPDVFLSFNRNYLLGLMTTDGIVVAPVPVLKDPKGYESWAANLVRSYNDGTLKGFPLARSGDELSPVNPPGRIDENILDRAYSNDLIGGLKTAREYAHGAAAAPMRYAAMPGYDEFEMAFLRYRENKNADVKKFLTTELKRLEKYYDPVWGGFFRLSGKMEGAGEKREKLLGENARAIEVLLPAYQLQLDPVFAGWIEKTVGYTLKYLGNPKGGFYGSQASDVMGPRGPISGDAYYSYSDVTRCRIGMPARDKNIYADGNSEMVIALLRAADLMDRAEWRNAALKALDRLVSYAWNEKQGVAHYINGRNEAFGFGMLNDNALFTAALIEAYEATGRTEYLKIAEKAAYASFGLFWNTGGAGFFWGVTPDQMIARINGAYQPVRENALMARNLDRLYFLLGDKAALALSGKTLEAYAGDFAPGVFAVDPLYAAAAHFYTHFPIQITVVGDSKDKNTGALLLAARKFYEPLKVVETLDPKEDAKRLSKLPYQARPMPTLYACVETACAMPVDDPAKVAERLRRFVERYMDEKNGQLP
jgi:uncharacterized protein